MKDEWASGYDDIWMNEEEKNAYGPLMDNNCFNVDIHEQNHHEMNKVLEKNEHLMQK